MAMLKNLKKVMVPLLVMLSVLIFFGGCELRPLSTYNPITVRRATLYEYSSFKDQPSGIAVSTGGRIFISFPRWFGNPSYSVAELMSGGALRPFPDAAWNIRDPGAGSPEAHFISAEGMTIDGKNTLWILDSALLNLKKIWRGGAKLVGVDLGTNRVTKVIVFDQTVVRDKSYLRHVCVDQWSRIAYISDAGSGAIIVTDLDTGLSRRVLADNPSTRAEPGVVVKTGGRTLLDERGKPAQLHVDGIALDPDSNFLYYHALTARTLYRIHTQYLNNPLLSQTELGTHVERLTDTGPVDGMVMDDEFNLFLTMPDENAVKRYRVYDGTLATLAQDPHISWPNSISISPERYLYFTDSQFNRLPYFNQGKDQRTPPYKVFRVSKIFPPPP